MPLNPLRHVAAVGGAVWLALAPALALPMPDRHPDTSLMVAAHAMDPYHRHRGNGYHVNRYGYGNYKRGPNGSFGGYPAGSAGAQILQQQQEKKCQYAPESC